MKPVAACPYHSTPRPPAVAAPSDPSLVWTEAETFLDRCAQELRWSAETLRRRRMDVARELERTGTYTHSTEELGFGAKLAWYNHNRCVGKLYWRSLVLRDQRDVRGGEAMAKSLDDHLHMAFNNGRIRPVITVFAPNQPDAPGPKIVSPQLVQYAGYRQADGSVIGDPATADLTDRIVALGWAPGEGRFDRLPVLIRGSDGELSWYPIDPATCPDVPINHPALDELGLRWYAYPTVSDMRLEIGGVTYPAAPFSGWYVSTEIGARDFCDRHRYNLLPTVAERLGLDTSSDRTLWKDRALTELTAAVISSYDAAGVRMADHHTMADQFHRFVQTQQRAGRPVTGEWSWIIPPMASSTTPVFHETYDPTVLRPNFFRD